MKKEIKMSDYDIEAVMGRLLITGVIISGSLILIRRHLLFNSTWVFNPAF